MWGKSAGWGGKRRGNWLRKTGRGKANWQDEPMSLTNAAAKDDMLSLTCPSERTHKKREIVGGALDIARPRSWSSSPPMGATACRDLQAGQQHQQPPAAQASEPLSDAVSVSNHPAFQLPSRTKLIAQKTK